jgi:hypothetical protein
MNQQLGRTLQDTMTSLPPADVLAAAKRFFARRNTIYAAFIEKEGPTFVAMRGQGGEEVIIGVAPGADGATRVTGSTYLFDQQVTRFFATLPAPRPPAAAASAGLPSSPAGAQEAPAGGAPAPKAGAGALAGSASGNPGATGGAS